ncbi:MAG: hypothetical protein MR704_13215, partial [Clostridia bacterium]|nr:hypothetical protein [Clostridia bacterium]
LCTGCFSLLAIIIGLLMIIDFIIEDLMLNSYLQKNFHTLFQWLLQSRHTLCRHQRMARQEQAAAKRNIL